jgi:PAS domain S-box-containing protein
MSTGSGSDSEECRRGRTEDDVHPHPGGRESFEALEARYNRLLESLHDMTFVAARNGKLLEVNQAGVDTFGFDSKEEILDLDSIASLCGDPGDLEVLRRQIEEEGFVKDFPVKMKRKDGTRFLACISATLWPGEDGVISYEGILRDVSESRKWQNALIKSMKDINDLRESDESSRELVGHIMHMLMIMSHDIRGPLVAIAATLKLLIRGTYGGMDQSVANTLKELITRIRSLLGVAEDYLGKMHSVEGSFKIQGETLDLRQDVIDPILDEISNDIQKDDITIDNRLGAIPAGTIRINVNKIWLKAVFRNLFKNAIKYGGKGCRIAFGFEDHGSHYRLNVYNSGTPIPEEHRQKLFTRFGRIGADARGAPDGVGLGLYLIKEIIKKHGGDIWYEARPDGSAFIFTLIKEGAGKE